jgi:hypothetical protein
VGAAQRRAAASRAAARAAAESARHGAVMQKKRCACVSGLLARAQRKA